MKTISVNKLVISSLFIASSVLLSNVSIMSTIAFDSLPAFLGGLVFGPLYGGVIGAFGHLITAVLKGFPYGLVIHFITAIAMFVTVAGFSTAYGFCKVRAGKAVTYIISALVGVILNGPVSIAVLYRLILPLMGAGGVIFFLLVLSAAALANIILAFTIYFFIENNHIL